jgi:tetratricopeptide (TPR) repeat protein
MQVRTKSSQYKNLKLRQNIVSNMNFSSKSRIKKLNGKKLENNLRTVNKYIFVQDFEKAESILKQLSFKHPDDYEILFRRVEVSSNRDTLSELLHDLKKLSKEYPSSKAINFAILLGSIRIFSKNDTEKDKKTTLKKKSEHPQKEIEYPQNAKMPLINFLSNKKIRINRTLDIPDDYFPEELPIAELSFPDENDKLNKEKLNLKEELYHKAIDLQLNDPENYAACFVAGCALESVGRLSEAIELWNHAYRLKPNSTSLLATLTELQQIGVIPDTSVNYSEKFEAIDKYLVHGHFETHTSLYNEFINTGDHKNAINALRTLADWLQNQYGEVPVEIEILCLLGAMQAYKLSNNIPAAEACRSEVENIVIACKKSPRDMNQIYFIAQLCEEYGLKPLARICYFAILISKDSSPELIVQTASHCVSNISSDGLLECLKVAYKNSHGSPEIRFCMLLCGLKISLTDITEYMHKKNKARDYISKDINNEITLSMLEELNNTYQFDPEIHYYLGEIQSRIGNYREAKKHFQTMFSLDYYNTDGLLRYIFFLLKTRDYSTAREIALEGLQLSSLSEQQANEMHWSIAATYFSEGDFNNSYEEISKSLANDPWNHSYLILLLRSSINIDRNHFLKDNELIINSLEEFILNNNSSSAERNVLIDKIIKHGLDCIHNSYSEYAWALVKSTILISENISDNLLYFIAKAGAGFNSRLAVQEMLLLLKQKSSNKEFNFATLSACIAQIYSLSGNWPLVDEWLSIAKNNQGLSAKLTKQKLFELEALSITMKGADLKKAQTLLEAAIDSYENIQKVPLDTKVLHGYILVAQGQFRVGIEKMQNNISTNASIQSLYFLIKGLERAGQLKNTSKESLTQLFNIYPTNTFEQKMVEEIFFAVGSKNNISPVGLAC